MAKGKYKKWLLPESLTLLEGWARDGLTDEQIAAKMSISPSTLYDWISKYSEISEAIKKGKEVPDYEVESALHKSATGYEYIEEIRERVYNKATKQYELVPVKQTIKHMPPNPVSIIFWLKNRKRDKWRDKVLENVNNTEILNDGFIDALTQTASDDWSEGDV